MLEDYIERKNIKKGSKTIIYGKAGVGKSTFGYHIPAKKVLYISLENGMNNFTFDNVTKVKTRDDITATDVIDILRMVRDDDRNMFTTIVIDSLTALESLIQKLVCKRQKNPVNFISEIGFAKGFDECKKEFQNILEIFNELTELNVNIVLIAHEKIVSVTNPSGENYDYIDIAVDKRVREVLIPMFDTVALLTTNIQVKDGKATGSSTRVLKVTTDATFIAKNRKGINDIVAINDYKSIM